MDAGDGRFVTASTPDALRAELDRMRSALLADYDRNIGRFVVGEHLEIKGSIFRVVTISRTGRMVLRLQPRSNG